MAQMDGGHTAHWDGALDVAYQLHPGPAPSPGQPTHRPAHSRPVPFSLPPTLPPSSQDTFVPANFGWCKANSTAALLG